MRRGSLRTRPLQRSLTYSWGQTVATHNVLRKDSGYPSVGHGLRPEGPGPVARLRGNRCSAWSVSRARGRRGWGRAPSQAGRQQPSHVHLLVRAPRFTGLCPHARLEGTWGTTGSTGRCNPPRLGHVSRGSFALPSQGRAAGTAIYLQLWSEHRPVRSGGAWHPGSLGCEASGRVPGLSVPTQGLGWGGGRRRPGALGGQREGLP